LGYLSAIYDAVYDPIDASNPNGQYTPYTFRPINMTMGRDFGRREAVMAIPGMDSVLDGNGRGAGSIDRREQSFGFRVFCPNDDLDAAYDLLAASLGPGTPMRLVYQPDNGPLRYTIGSNPKIAHTTVSANKGGASHADFTVTWRIRPDWRWRYSETVQLFPTVATTFAPTNSETFTARGTTIITANPQPFLVDARGTAGNDLPTLPDTGSTITLTGPCGGDGGIQVANNSITLYDTQGTPFPLYFLLPFNLPTAYDSCSLNFASQTFLHNGRPFRPLKPGWQREWFRIQPGIVNNCALLPINGNVLLGGGVTVDWIRRFI